LRTKEWWDVERQHFKVFVSVTTINELRAGRFHRQADCMNMAPLLGTSGNDPQSQGGVGGIAGSPIDS
jgi:hypothetical protein